MTSLAHRTQTQIRNRLRQLPEYLEAEEVAALMRSAPHAQARLFMAVQWRAGLRISEVLALETRDLSLDADHPTLRVRRGKGCRPRVVPVHPELKTVLETALNCDLGTRKGKIIKASRMTAHRWLKRALANAVELRTIAKGRRISSHTLRHSYARHLLMGGVPINYLSRWLGHSSIQTTLIYIDLMPRSGRAEKKSLMNVAHLGVSEDRRLRDCTHISAER